MERETRFELATSSLGSCGPSVVTSKETSDLQALIDQLAPLLAPAIRNSTKRSGSGEGPLSPNDHLNSTLSALGKHDRNLLLGALFQALTQEEDPTTPLEGQDRGTSP